MAENSKSPLKIAVTGGAGSGKSAVCHRFQELGAIVVDMDLLAREAVAPGSPGLEQVVRRFGGRVLDEKGRLNRGRLREIILSDPQARRDLEAIVHPEVLRRMQALLKDAESAGATLFVAEVPLLFEAGLKNAFDRVIVVSAPEEERVRRLVKRDSVAFEQAEALIGIQMPESEKIKQADFVVENRGGTESLKPEVERLYHRLVKEAEKGGESA